MIFPLLLLTAAARRSRWLTTWRSLSSKKSPLKGKSSSLMVRLFSLSDTDSHHWVWQETQPGPVQQPSVAIAFSTPSCANRSELLWFWCICGLFKSDKFRPGDVSLPLCSSVQRRWGLLLKPSYITSSPHTFFIQLQELWDWMWKRHEITDCYINYRMKLSL